MRTRLATNVKFGVLVIQSYNDFHIPNVTGRRTLTFAGGDTLVLEETGTFCPPGNSGNAPGSLVSFGNPFTLSFTWSIASGTGQFAGASGSGTGTDRLAGDAGHARLTGTITLP